MQVTELSSTPNRLHSERPATYLAKTLDLLNVKDVYKERVKRLVIVDFGTPAPIILCPKEVGDALKFPGARLDKDFSWAPAHPVVDAYKAYKPMPYDAPLYDLAATHFAIHPDSGFFELSPGSGNMKSIGIVPAKKDELLTALIDIATAKPAAPAPNRGGAITPAIVPPNVKQ